MQANKIAIIKRNDEIAAAEKKEISNASQPELQTPPKPEPQPQPEPLSPEQQRDQRIRQLEKEQAAEIQKLIQDRNAAIEAVPPNPRNRSQRRLDQNRVWRDYRSRIEKVEREYRVKKEQVRASGLPSWAKRGWNPVDFPTTSLSEYAERRIAGKEAKAEYNRQSSITTAKSNAVIARNELEKTVREFESKREMIDPGLAGDAAAAFGTNQPTRATKKRPGVMQSEFFSGDEKTPASIIGTTPELSEKAQVTFEETQRQQKKLHIGITGAPYYTEAIQLRKDAMKINPYVGTANTLLYKGGVVGSSGVLIEKVYNPEPIITEEVIEPELIIEPQPKILQPEILQTEIPAYAATDEIIDNKEIPEYIFPQPLIELGDPRQNKINSMWRTMSSLADTEIVQPSKADKILNQYVLENQDAISKSKGGEVSPIEIPIINALRDYGVEFGLSLASLGIAAKGKLFNEPELQTQNEISKLMNSVKFEKSLETVALDSVTTQSRKNPATINPVGGTPNVIAVPSQPSFETEKYINDKIKTPEGLEYLAGSIIATIGTSILPIKGRLPKPKTQSEITKALDPKNYPSVSDVVKAAEPHTISVKLESGETVKLTDFNYVEPAKPKKRGQIQPSPTIKTKKIDVGGQKITVIDYDAAAKEAAKTSRTSASTKAKAAVINSKIGRTVGIGLPSNNAINKLNKETKPSMLDKLMKEALNNDPLKFISMNFPGSKSEINKLGKTSKASKATSHKNKKSVKETIINTKIMRELSKAGLPQKDKGKAPKGGETPWQREKAENSMSALPEKTMAQIQKEQQQILQSLEKSKNTKKPSGIKSQKSNQGSDIIIDEIILNPNRPQITQPKETMRILDAQGIATGMLENTKSKQSQKLQDDMDRMLRDITKQQPKFGTKVTPETPGKRKTRTVVTPSISLIVSPGKQGTKDILDITHINPPRQKTGQIHDVPEKKITKIPKPPRFLNVPGITGSPGKKRSSRKPRGTVKYSVWNVDTERIGALPGEELMVSSSSKIFRVLDERQRRAHKSKNSRTKRKSGSRKKTTKRGKKR